MTFISLSIGLEGSGKTLYAVMLAYIYKKKYNYNIISNMKSLKFKDYDIDILPELMNNETNEENYLALIDEIYQYIDSRRGISKKNIESSYSIFQLRKKRINLIGTAQYYRSIDIRARSVFTNVFFSEYDKSSFNLFIKRFDGYLNYKGNINITVNPILYNMYDHREVINDNRKLFQFE